LAASVGFFALAGALDAVGSLAGGGTSGGGGSASAGSGSTSMASTDSGIGGTASAPVSRERVGVTIQVMGHIFDTPQTGLRIAEILRDTTGATDVKIT